MCYIELKNDKYETLEDLKHLLQYSVSSSFTFGNFFKLASSKAAFAALCSVICSRCSSKNFLL